MMINWNIYRGWWWWWWWWWWRWRWWRMCFFFSWGQTLFNSIPNGHHCLKIDQSPAFPLPQDIDAVEAWRFFPAPPSNNVVVAVIDTGIDYTHQDLKDAGHSAGHSYGPSHVMGMEENLKKNGTNGGILWFMVDITIVKGFMTNL